MGDKTGFDAEGLKVGGFHVRVVPAWATSDDLDTVEGRERARQREDDERAAQHGGGAAPIASEVETDGESIAAEDVDASIAEARERASRSRGVPILIRDPVTGMVTEKT